MSDKNKPAAVAGLGDQVREILKLEPEKRLRALYDARDTDSLVQSMPPQELWITIKTVGENDALELFELAGDDQLVFFQDMECWRGGELDNARLLAWFEKLTACGQSKMAQWLKTVDAEMFVSSLSRFLKVNVPEENDDPIEIPGTLPPMTIDGKYFLYFNDEKSRDAVMPVLSLFANLHFELYAQMIEGLMWEMGVETEEMAKKWRDARLRDLGIPDLEEAMEIYRYLEERTFNDLPEKSKPVVFSFNKVPTRFPLVQHGNRDALLLRALDLVTDGEQLDGIAQELTHLSNRVIIADGLDMSDPKQIKKAVDKVRATVSMGLELLTDNDVVTAAELLQKKWLVNLFQTGHSASIKLSRKAHRLYKTGWLKKFPGGEKLLGQELGNVLSGLNRSRPVWYSSPDEHRSFMSLEEVDRADEALKRIDYYGELFFNRLGTLGPDPGDWTWDNAYPVDVDFAVVFRTSLANAAAGKGFQCTPLDPADLVNLIKTAFDEPDKNGDGTSLPRKIKESVKQDMAEFIENKDGAASVDEIRFRDELVREALEFLESELGMLDPDDIDPKYIQGLLIKID